MPPHRHTHFAQYRLNKCIHAAKPYIKRHGLSLEWTRGLCTVINNGENFIFVKTPETGDELLLKDMENFVLRMKRLDKDVLSFNERVDRRVRERADGKAALTKSPAIIGGQHDRRGTQNNASTKAQPPRPTSAPTATMTMKAEAVGTPPTKKLKSIAGATIPLDPALGGVLTPPSKTLPPLTPTPPPSDRMQSIMNYNFPPGLFPNFDATFPRRLFPLTNRIASQPIPIAPKLLGSRQVSHPVAPHLVLPSTLITPQTPDLPPLSLPSTAYASAYDKVAHEVRPSSTAMKTTNKSSAQHRGRAPIKKTAKRASGGVHKRKRSASLLSPVSSLDSPRRRILKQHYWGRLQKFEPADGPGNGKGKGGQGLDANGTARIVRLEGEKRMMPWVDWDAIEDCEARSGQRCRHTHLKDVEVEELDEEEVARCKQEY